MAQAKPVTGISEALTESEFEEALPTATTIETYTDEKIQAARENGLEVRAHVEDGRATGEYTVKSQESSEKYLVEMNTGPCSCDKAGDVCEHRRRVALAITYAGLPATGDRVGGAE